MPGRCSTTELHCSPSLGILGRGSTLSHTPRPCTRFVSRTWREQNVLIFISTGSFVFPKVIHYSFYTRGCSTAVSKPGSIVILNNKILSIVVLAFNSIIQERGRWISVSSVSPVYTARPCLKNIKKKYCSCVEIRRELCEAGSLPPPLGSRDQAHIVWSWSDRWL